MRVFKYIRESGFDGEVSIEASTDDNTEQLPTTLNIMKRLGGDF